MPSNETPTSKPSISKTQSSFYRRIYVAYLINNGTASVPDIIAATGMPRRTAQDTVNALGELDILCEFERKAGARHNTGGYVIRDWGPIDANWVNTHHRYLKQALGYS
ncbi:winged helix-turn-helix domain-containing protein [Halomonas sp. M20]|uniref:winged helix-turn-helix domain-containing protein n=1 Tax=Halomonas sp. M20 TaxID=2763264 RepID=UPI001D0B74DF|nr:winged helix-turn-helix domain-containing protein [Halomonas sp. M20]